jgi:hypothetical protein
MNTDQRFRKTQAREFFAHHMLLHAAGRQLEEAEANEVGRSISVSRRWFFHLSRSKHWGMLLGAELLLIGLHSSD